MFRRAAADRLVLCLGFSALVPIPFGGADAANYRVLYSFSGEADGGAPLAGLMTDHAGNLYGTTSRGGRLTASKSRYPDLGGVVFRFGPDGSYAVLHAFPSACMHGPRQLCQDRDPERRDGASPEGALVQDRSGNLYGTTTYGGQTNDGVVYRIAPDGSEQVLHDFTGGNDGKNPVGDLLLDGQGNLFGTTVKGGGSTCGCGTVFRIAPDGTETVLHAFIGGGGDGALPAAGLIADNTGTLYGTTAEDGHRGRGTVFSITPDGAETILYDFPGDATLTHPDSKLVLDADGNLYGTTEGYKKGVAIGGVFELRPDGSWAPLLIFGHQHGDMPTGVIEDASGNFYGTTSDGGGSCQIFRFGCGVVYKMPPNGTEAVLHRFGQKSGDGIWPDGTLVADQNGRLYGTTSAGGAYGLGTIYTIIP